MYYITPGDLRESFWWWFTALDTSGKYDVKKIKSKILTFLQAVGTIGVWLVDTTDDKNNLNPEILVIFQLNNSEL